MFQTEISVSRRACLLSVPAVAGVVAGWSILRTGSAAQESAGAPSSTIPDSFPSQDPRKVADMVGASHGRIERVKALLAEAPQFANATWDWGFGDWETAIGAASHVGNREIAAMLIAHGARPDIFTWAMLGNVDAVRACVTAQPGIERLRGPHGLTLMHHARAGGDGATAVVEYLNGLPGADERPTEPPVSDEMRDAIIGEYAWSDAADARLRVFIPEKRSWLVITRGSESPRRLTHLGDATFHPAGAPDVKIRFVIEGARATRLNITTPAPMLEATRVG